jgi:Holliday junction resolvasome RuvABC endonuclease subunit
MAAGIQDSAGTPARDGAPLVRRVLGLDPGTRVLGYGCIDWPSAGPRLVEAGTLSASASHALPRRLGRLLAELEGLLADLRPDLVVVERAFAGKNIRSALSLGEGRGLALAVAARAGAEVVELTPAEGAPTDATDALALALAFVEREQLGLRLQSGLRGAPPQAPRPSQASP